MKGGTLFVSDEVDTLCVSDEGDTLYVSDEGDTLYVSDEGDTLCVSDEGGHLEKKIDILNFKIYGYILKSIKNKK